MSEGTNLYCPVCGNISKKKNLDDFQKGHNMGYDIGYKNGKEEGRQVALTRIADTSDITADSLTMLAYMQAISSRDEMIDKRNENVDDGNAYAFYNKSLERIENIIGWLDYLLDCRAKTSISRLKSGGGK